MVTSNAGDFDRLASREEQWAWLEPVARWLADEGEDLANKEIVVTGTGKFTVRDIPPP